MHIWVYAMIQTCEKMIFERTRICLIDRRRISRGAYDIKKKKSRSCVIRYHRRCSRYRCCASFILRKERETRSYRIDIQQRIKYRSCCATFTNARNVYHTLNLNTSVLLNCRDLVFLEFYPFLPL